MNIVVGSGPAGVAAARALLDAGESVTLLDVGRTLEEPNASTLKNLHRLPRPQWTPESLQLIKGSSQSTRRGVDLKTVYGSDFAYRSLDEIDSAPSSILIRASHALGGLSNVWGGAVLPYNSKDLGAWPFPAENLRPHYEKILSRLDFSASEDDLSKLFPLYAKPAGAFKSSRQAESFLKGAAEHREPLQKEGLHVGRSRLAARAEGHEPVPGCVYCGACLTGCPYELIFNSAVWIEQWKDQLRFAYRPKILVERIKETSRSVEVMARDLSSGQAVSFPADRVFLAGGFLSTSKIVLSSLERYHTDFPIRASQYFLFPFLSQRSTSDVRTEELHTMSQFFIEVSNEGVSPHFINLQGYTYNSFLGEYVDRRLGPLAAPLRRLTDAWLGRLMIVQGYLHSDDSPSIKMRLIKTPSGDRLRFSRVDNPRTKIVLDRLMKLLARNKRSLGASPLRWMMTVGKIGDGSHLGGCFPMHARPGPSDSDLLGRPFGFRRTHVVDSSVFPSIPATTITLSVMANAHRIASAAIPSSS